MGSGSTFEAISRSDLEGLEIPLPPLPEQQRIAAVLREQTAAVERARAAAEVELEAVEALPAALLRRAFNGEL
jgi:type I restriction enzyme S subunit